MSPRPYRMDKRQVATEKTRAAIIDAARELLDAGSGVLGFSMEAVARQAGVARMTVYYQFGSKRRLLEILFDDLAARAELGPRLAVAFSQAEALDALAGVLVAFAHFWTRDRRAMRRVRALAVLDVEFGEAVRARDERRRQVVQTVLRRSAEQRGQPAAEVFDRAVDLLHTLSSFETFDTLAGADHEPSDVIALVTGLALASLTVEPAT